MPATIDINKISKTAPNLDESAGYSEEELEDNADGVKECPDCGGVMKYAVVDGIGNTLHEVYECIDCGYEQEY